MNFHLPNKEPGKPGHVIPSPEPALSPHPDTQLSSAFESLAAYPVMWHAYIYQPNSSVNPLST